MRGLVNIKIGDTGRCSEGISEYKHRWVPVGVVRALVNIKIGDMSRCSEGISEYKDR